MSVYVNRNVKNRWEKIEVTDAEIADITKRNFVANMNIAIDCVANVRKAMPASKRLEGQNLSAELIDGVALALIEKMTKPLHYDVENYVDEKLAKENLL